MIRRFIGIGVAASLCVAGSLSAAPQRQDDRRDAIMECETELEFQITKDEGGRTREAQARIDDRALDVRSTGSTVALSGRGNYTRNRLDRGRDFTFSCSYNTRTSRASVRYDFRVATGGWGNRPGSGLSGRPFFSGGIVNVAGNRGLDVQGESMADGANIQLWDFGGKDNQRWDIFDLGRGQYAIINVRSGKALEIRNPDGRDGANVQQAAWRERDNQKWRLERARNGTYEIVNIATSKCLDADAGGLYQNGGNVQQWSCSKGPNQAWRLAK